jgi:hypothetical protein
MSLTGENSYKFEETILVIVSVKENMYLQFLLLELTYFAPARIDKSARPLTHDDLEGWLCCQKRPAP